MVDIGKELIFEDKLLNRFWMKVEKTETCWVWLGAKQSDGYGCFGVNGKILLSHRFSYELLKGDIPKGLELDHLCRNVKCINPSHLEAVTHKENMRRGNSNKIHHHNRDKTHCNYGHPFSGGNLLVYGSHRHCKICDKRRSIMKNERSRLLRI